MAKAYLESTRLHVAGCHHEPDRQLSTGDDLALVLPVPPIPLVLRSRLASVESCRRKESTAHDFVSQNNTYRGSIIYRVQRAFAGLPDFGVGRNEPRTHLTERLMPLTEPSYNVVQPITRQDTGIPLAWWLTPILSGHYQNACLRPEENESDDVDLIADLLLADGSL